MILFRDCTLWDSKGRLSLLSVGCLCRASHTNWNSKIKKRKYWSRGHLFSHSWEYEYIMSRFSWKSSRTARDETVSMHFTYAQAFSWINTKRHKYACKLLILIRSHHSMTSEAVDRKKDKSNILLLTHSWEKIIFSVTPRESIVLDIRPKWFPRWVACGVYQFWAVCALSKKPFPEPVWVRSRPQDLGLSSWPGKGDCQGQLVRGPCEPLWPIRGQGWSRADQSERREGHHSSPGTGRAGPVIAVSAPLMSKKYGYCY